MNYYNSKKIRRLIKIDGLTIQEAAQKCECSVSTMNNLLSGEDMKLSTLTKICNYLKINIADLFTPGNDLEHYELPESTPTPKESELERENTHYKEVLFEKERLIQSLQHTIELLSNKSK